MRFLIIILALITLTACKREVPATMTFVAFGDAPNNRNEQIMYESLIKNINEAKPSLVIHLGDTHSSKICNNNEIDNIRDYMNDFVAPVLYTPGDNDWTDCGNALDGDFNPLERLNYLRQTHFNSGTTLGKNPISVINQKKAGFPENMRFMKDNIGFITVHVVGNKNNLNTSDLDSMKEFYDRNKANLTWLDESFMALKKADAIVVSLHSNMFVRKFTSFRNIALRIKHDKKLLLSYKTYGRLFYRTFKIVDRLSLPYRDIGRSIQHYSSELKKPVLLLHGSDHDHTVYKPFKKNPYLHAITVHGSPDVKAIEISVRPKSKRPFKVERVFNP